MTWEQGESDQQALASVYDIGHTLGQDLGQSDSILILRLFAIFLDLSPILQLVTLPWKDPEVSALRAKAFLSGLQDAGVHGCLKHFPGQGRATSDTHLSEGRINCSAAEFEREDLSLSSFPCPQRS